jgi:hypothetical protein
MCSIEEAWAGQLFEGRKVQSQADLHRKYMPISDNLLERNNEFSIGRNEPQSREGTRGINTKQLSSNNINDDYSSNMQSGNLKVNFENNISPSSTYRGLNQRPSYMSIYDNASENVPMPSMTRIGGKENFNDINQAFTVSKTVDRFMNQSQQHNNNNVDDINVLLNEDNDMDRKILNKKFNMLNSEQFNNTSTNQNTDTSQFHKSFQDILQRLEHLESRMNDNNTRNMYDMVLYILVGMLIAFFIYAILRK